MPPNKAGIHVIRHAGRIDDIIAAGPAVLKLVGDWSKTAPENTLVIGRLHIGYDAQSQYNAGLSPHEAEQRLLADMLSTIQLNPHIIYWEGHNEPVWSTPEEMSWYAQFEISRMQSLAQMGKRAVLGNFATGTPPLELWPAFLPAIEAGSTQYMALLGLHEYSYPWLWWMTGKYQLDPNADEGDEGWTTLRYRKVWRNYIQPAGLYIPIVMTEAGLDPLVDPKPPGMPSPVPPWRELGPYWAAHPEGEVEYTSDKELYYWRQLEWYFRELEKDPYVLGATVYCSGHWGPDCAWRDFDISDTKIEGEMIEYIESQPSNPDPTPPPEPPAEPEELIDSTALIDNPIFTGGWTRDTHDGWEFGEIHTPEGWVWFWREGEYRRIEAKVIDNVPPYLDPPRVHVGNKAVQAFTQFGRMFAGLYQTVSGLIPGERYRFMMDAHAWSAHYPPLDVPSAACSTGVGCGPVYIPENEIPPLSDVPPGREPTLEEMLNDAIGNFVFNMGVQLSGNPDPFTSASWGPGAAIYNAYHTIPYVEFIAPQNGTVTLFVRARSLWPFKNSDIYLDNARLYRIVEAEEPIDKYPRHYIIADPNYMNEAQLDSAYAEGRFNLMTTGPSWQDAVPKAEDRPEEWETNTVYGGPLPVEDRPRYREWVANRDPKTELIFDEEGGGNWYIDIVDQLPTNPGSPYYPYKQRNMSDVEWVVVHHTAGARRSGDQVVPHIKAIAEMHCGSPRYYPGIAYTVMIDDDGVVYKTNRFATISFAHGVRNSGRDENKLGIAVCLLGNFTQGQEPTTAQIESLKRVIAELDKITPKKLQVIGHKDLTATQCPGENWPWMPGWGWPNPKPPQRVKIGLHDEPGGRWMVDNGVEGICLVHWLVRDKPEPRDFTHLSNHGIQVIARLGWGYSHGEGTLPRPDHKESFVSSVISTMLSSQGVSLWHVGNEPNNKSEWPGYGSPQIYELTPWYVTDIYNDIWHGVGGAAKLGPAPLDPYFGPGSNNMDWWLYFLNNIAGADAFYLHLKTQTNNPDEVHSYEKFKDYPLQWQFLHTRAGEPYIAVIPSKSAGVPIYVTELNPQFLDYINGPLGWKPDNTEWIRQTIKYFGTQPVQGLVYYRYELAGHQEPFGLANKPALLEEIRRSQ